MFERNAKKKAAAKKVVAKQPPKISEGELTKEYRAKRAELRLGPTNGLREAEATLRDEYLEKLKGY